MKNNKIIIWVVVLSAMALPFVWFVTNPNIKIDESDRMANTIKNPLASFDSVYNGSMYEGNYVWGGAMNLVWNDLCDNILKGPLQLNSSDRAALKTVKIFNNRGFSKEDLDEDSYYIKSGYGQAIVDEVNRESRKKFPDKSFGDLNITLGERDIMTYAYFLKKVKYPEQFDKFDKFEFNKEFVKGFYADGDKQKSNVLINKYWSDDKFIIGLRLTNPNDQLYVVKGFDDVLPEAVVAAINENKSTEIMGHNDVFQMPELHLNHHRDYTELSNKFLANKDFKNYSLSKVAEDIKLDLDNKGARIENQAVMLDVWGDAYEAEKPKVRHFVLNKPFWVVMKRFDSLKPYFILKVNNSKIMTRADGVK